MNFAGQLFFSLFSNKKKEPIAERGERKLHRQSMQAIIDFTETFLGNVRDADIRRDIGNFSLVLLGRATFFSFLESNLIESNDYPQSVSINEQFYWNNFI